MFLFGFTGVSATNPCSIWSPKVDLVLIGYPCKSVSKQNNAATSFLDTSGITGLGFDSMMKYVDYSSPHIVLAENVATLVHKRKKFHGECPIDIQNDAFRRRGYVAFHRLVSSSHFGLCQERHRVWAIYIKTTCLVVESFFTLDVWSFQAFVLEFGSPGFILNIENQTWGKGSGVACGWGRLLTLCQPWVCSNASPWSSRSFCCLPVTLRTRVLANGARWTIARIGSGERLFPLGAKLLARFLVCNCLLNFFWKGRGCVFGSCWLKVTPFVGCF